MASEEEYCQHVLFVMNVVCLGIICGFGFAGNTLSFWILRSLGSDHNGVVFLLRALAMADNLVLMCDAFNSMASYYVEEAGEWVEYFPLAVWPLIHITHMVSVWITVIIAINRYLVVCRPLQAPVVCTEGRVRFQVAVVTVLCVVYNIPHFLEYRPRNVTVQGYNISKDHLFKFDLNSTVLEVTDLHRDTTYMEVYRRWMACIVNFVAPLTFLVILSSLVIREIRNAAINNRRVRAPGAGISDADSVTITAVVMIFVFIVCYIPAAIFIFSTFVTPDFNDTCPHGMFYLFNMANLLLSLNSAVNFLIYCVAGKKFRKGVWKCMQCKHWECGM